MKVINIGKTYRGFKVGRSATLLICPAMPIVADRKAVIAADAAGFSEPSGLYGAWLVRLFQ